MKLPRMIEGLARALAIAGGMVLVALTVLVVVSITGRALLTLGFGVGPVPGDFELVEAGTGFAVFAFLPWCQLKRGHATVDLFTNMLSAGANRIIDLVTEILMTLVLGLIAWRLYAGTMDKFSYGETTFILQFPVWWPLAASLVAAVIAVVVSFYLTVIRVVEVKTGRAILAPAEGVIH
jgi:TRAP-type C4-dicarboxylate transport system permease small subunit